MWWWLAVGSALAGAVVFNRIRKRRGWFWF